MPPPPEPPGSGRIVGLTNLPSALDCGRICATQARSQRDLQECASEYGTLFPGDLYDGALFTAVAGVNAFSAPWLTAAELRLTNRAALWAFALDRAIDSIAASRADVQRVVDGCLAAGTGDTETEGDELTRLLAVLRAELMAADASPRLYLLWLDVLHSMIDAMAREWEWIDARTASPSAPLPSVEEYVGNSQNLGLSFVYVSHWISTGGWSSLDRVDGLMSLCLEAEKVIRLANDLSTYERDLASGDLNVLHLGVSPAQVSDLVQAIAAGARDKLRGLGHDQDGLGAYLDRQIGFNLGFYPFIDYWGSS